MQTAEQEFVNRIKLSRGTTEPSPEAPTENTEAVNVSEDAPVEEVVETEAIANEEITTEIEEPAETEIAQATDENESEDLYVEYQGREINLKDVYETEQGQLRQADYTRKTQDHAEDVKTFNAEKEAFADKQSKFDGHIATLEAMINEEALDAEALAELREFEPEEYIKYTEKMTNRKKFVDSNKSVAPTNSVDMKKVSADLFANHPEWQGDDGKQSQKFIDDTNLMTKYAETRGIGQAEIATFEAKHYEIMLDAARYKSQNSKNVAIEKKVRLAPVSTKPRAAARGVQTDLDAALKAFKKNPSDKNAVALRKLKRQLNN